jgi:hypothetical protein
VVFVNLANHRLEVLEVSFQVVSFSFSIIGEGALDYLTSVDRPVVRNKRENFRLWQSGEFGNKLRAWRSLDEWRSSGFAGLVVLRALMDGGGPCEYNLTPEQTEAVAQRWLSQGHPSDRIMVNEAAPEQMVLLQGEYLNDIHLGGSAYWGYFKYSREKAQMRDALMTASEVAQGLRSDLMLRLAMTPSSYDDWLLLLDRYHGHVFEVSIYERCLGDIPGRNALVWEVRRY